MSVIPLYARAVSTGPRAGRVKRKRKQRNTKPQKTPRVSKCGSKLVRFDAAKVAARLAAAASSVPVGPSLCRQFIA